MTARDCARFAPMLSARPGELPPTEEQSLLAHLAGCGDCQARLADGKAIEGMVAEALLAEAARVDFAPFVDQVMARVGRRRGFLGLLSRHKLATALAGLAPALAALGLILYLTGGPPDLEPELGDVEVVSEARAPVVLTTEAGPVVLLGDPDEPQGS